MITLRQEQKELVLDYFFQCGNVAHLESAKELIESDPRARELYDQLSSTLGNLDHIDHQAPDKCPDHLAEMTLNKLRAASASSEGSRLESLLAEESDKSLSESEQSTENIQISRFRSFWNNIPDVATVACVMLIIASVALPTFSHMRGKAHRVACASGMSRIGRGISQYYNDNNSTLPAVATIAGDPWWKVGDQQKNHSNTRHPWLIVKNSYVDPADFVCNASKKGIKENFTKNQLQKLNDFPSRRHITYSYMFTCPKRSKRQWNGQTVLMADLNPVFAKITPSTSKEEFDKLSIGDQLRNAMSPNHRKGQVILFFDGSATFKKVRILSGDDIYTAKDKTAYTGCEVPEDITDIFLVP